MERIEIPFNKVNIMFSIAGSALFVFSGAYLILNVPTHIGDLGNTLLKILGIASVLFFGATGYVGIRKLLEKRAGLVVDENGITDYSSGVSIGLIEWEDIEAIGVQQIMSTKFLLIFTTDPEKYLGKAKPAKRKIMEANRSLCGTPLAISSTALDYKVNDLETLLTERLHQYRTGRQNG